MFAPILPRPIIPNCIDHSFSDVVIRLVAVVFQKLIVADAAVHRCGHSQLRVSMVPPELPVAMDQIVR
jgi:hypothetical protein